MTRALATIREVLEIKPIPDADKIEAVRVDGWWVVCKKGEFTVGQNVVYFEIDSWIPETIAPFLFKGKEYNGVPGARLRTIKLRKQISQGLIMSMESLGLSYVVLEDSVDNLDFWLGIVKWDPPVSPQLQGLARGNFPSEWRKTDQERCQNILRDIKEHYDAGTKFEVTIKLDGSSMSVGTSHDGEYMVASRNINLKVEDNPDNTYIKTASTYYDSIMAFNSKFGSIQICGELIGEGIQGNPEGIKGHNYLVYDMFDPPTGTYIDPENRRDICRLLGLNHVPILHEAVTLKELGLETVDDLLEFAEGASMNAKRREGVVFKSVDGTFSFKAIANSYLMKEK